MMLEKLKSLGSKCVDFVEEHPYISSGAALLLSIAALAYMGDNDDFDSDDMGGGFLYRLSGINDGMDQETEISLFEDGMAHAGSEECPWFLSEEQWDYINGG